MSLPWQRTRSRGCDQQFQVARRIMRLLRHATRFFSLAYWEDGDKGFDQVMGTKVERRTNLHTPAL